MLLWFVKARNILDSLTMLKPSLRAVIAVAGACLFAGALHAAVPTFWQVSIEAEFLRGEVEHLGDEVADRMAQAVDSHFGVGGGSTS